jgi:hypothetical protein
LSNGILEIAKLAQDRTKTKYLKKNKKKIYVRSSAFNFRYNTGIYQNNSNSSGKHSLIFFKNF